jgi:hypothetical protein
MRRIFIVFSPRSLPYAEKCIESLFRNALEHLDVKLITDSPDDKQIVTEAVANIENQQGHVWQVIDQDEAGDRAEEQFKGFENLKAFRHGHPCWRKLTDPLLFTNNGEEMVILDPDLYFPNKFTFEPTPEKTLLLMWQPPNCLLPSECVHAAINASVKLAHHVDIGVAQLKKPIDLEWFDWLIGKLGGTDLPRIMHIEAIVWSALAMKIGGGYLNPQRWLCWHRSHWKRVLLKCGMSGIRILQIEALGAAKCFHACGMSKWWVADACNTGIFDSNNKLNELSTPMPFIELTPQRYRLEQRVKGTLRGLGYYSLINPD